MRKEELIKIVSDKDTDYKERTSAFIELSNLFAEEGNLAEGLKYAAMALITPFSPRPDVCICLGDRYLEETNINWAIKWYESALGNVCYDCDVKYYTWIPLIKISQAYLLSMNYEKAMKYAESAELFDPGNEDITLLKNAIEEAKKCLTEKSEKE